MQFFIILGGYIYKINFWTSLLYILTLEMAIPYESVWDLVTLQLPYYGQFVTRLTDGLKLGTTF